MTRFPATALVTGGSRGIGAGIAALLRAEGVEVLTAARSGADLIVDVADEESVAALRDTVERRFGALDLLVCSAGTLSVARVVDLAPEEWDRVMAVNARGPFLCARAFAPSMCEKRRGCIINVASIAGKTGAPYIAAYSASKHGVLGLTRSVALEVATKGVTVNAICPGYVDTEMTTNAVRQITAKTGRSAEEATEAIKRMSPQGRLVTPEEVAALALLLASEDGRGITGQAINVDGGSVLF